MNPIVFITGATAGIGKATAIKFAENNYDVIITGRRADRLETLKQELELKYGGKVVALCFDVRDKKVVKMQIASLPDEFKQISILVNNAGLSQDLTPIQNGDIEDMERMIDTNVKGLIYVSKAIMPFMIANKKGTIINIGSIAGKETYPNNNAYCASKYAVDSLTRTMRMDLISHNIRVTLINPGAVDTEFSTVRYKGDKERADATYKGFTPLCANDIAESIYYCASLPAHVNINELTIMPTAQASAGVFHKIL